jgi:hypothetical protein
VHTIVPPLSGCDFSGHWDTNSDSCAAYGLSHHAEDRLLPDKQTAFDPLDPDRSRTRQTGNWPYEGAWQSVRDEHSFRTKGRRLVIARDGESHGDRMASSTCPKDSAEASPCG